MQNKNILIYANCQGEAVRDFLNMALPRNKINFIRNFDYLHEKINFPKKLLRECDIFIYQPLDKKYGKYSTDYIIKNYLNKTAKLVSFPYIYFMGYFPSLIIDNKNTGKARFFGFCTEDCRIIRKMCKENKSIEEIYNVLQKKDLFTKEEVEKNLINTLKLLKKKEEITNIKLSSFIKKNFRKKDLFHTQNHPTKCLMICCVNQILKKIGSKNRIKDSINIKDPLAQAVFPIYPSTKQILKLDFEHNIIFDNQKMDLKEFIEIYKSNLYPLKVPFNRVIMAFRKKLSFKLNQKIGQIGLFIKKISPRFYYIIKEHILRN